MLEPFYHSSFKKDRKLMKRQNKNMDKLTEVMGLLINEQPLLSKHKNHPLYGNYINWWECHIEPDWLLIYRIENQQIIFNRTGSHSDLFG